MEPQAAGDGAANLEDQTIKFIQLPQNFSDDKECLLLQSLPLKNPDGQCSQEGDDPDSDDPDGDAPHDSWSQEVLSKRNQIFLGKHHLAVKGAGPIEAGNGLFAHAPITRGLEIPVKGPWFNTEGACKRWLEGITDEATREMYLSRVIRVSLGDDDKGHKNLFKVMTSPIGFVNHFTNLGNLPNCALIWKEGMPLGQHNLVLQTTRPITENRQLLLNYGPLHRCGTPIKRKRKRKD